MCNIPIVPGRVLRVNPEAARTVLQAEVCAVNLGLFAPGTPRPSRMGAGTGLGQAPGAFPQLTVLLILGVLLTCAMTGFQGESLRAAFVVMFTVPVAAKGALGTLNLTSTSFGLQAYIEVTMLSGSTTVATI